MKETQAMQPAQLPIQGRPPPRLWIKIPVETGNLIQGSGPLGGAALLGLAAYLPGPTACALPS
jgi:hypothetical protein